MTAPLFHKGNGGSVTSTASGQSATGINITNWTLDRKVRVTDITHSGSAGVAVPGAGVKEYSGTVKAFWDSANLMDAAAPGIIEGALLTLALKLGDSSVAYTLTGTLVDKLSINVDNQTGFVNYDFTFQGGVLTGPA